MENNKNKKFVKFQGDMLNFCDFIQVFVFTRNHHLKQQKVLDSRCIGVLPRFFVVFTKQRDLTDFLLALLGNLTIQNRGLLLKERICSLRTLRPLLRREAK